MTSRLHRARAPVLVALAVVTALTGCDLSEEGAPSATEPSTSTQQRTEDVASERDDFAIQTAQEIIKVARLIQERKPPSHPGIQEARRGLTLDLRCKLALPDFERSEASVLLDEACRHIRLALRSNVLRQVERSQGEIASTEARLAERYARAALEIFSAG